MNWQEAKSKRKKESMKWETIKRDFPQYDFLKTSYLVLCWGDFGQATFDELKYPLSLSKHVDLIRQENIRKEISGMARKIEELEKPHKRNNNDWIEKRIESIQKQITNIIESKADLVKNWAEARFNRLDFKGIKALMEHPLVSKDSYGIRIILNGDVIQ